MIPGLGNSHGEEIGYSLQYSSLENPHGQRNLVGYSPSGHKESGMTERLSTHTPTPVFLPGEFHGQRNLVGYSPLGYKESEHDWETNTYFTHNIIELVTNDFTLMCCPPGHLFFCFSGDSEVYREWSDLK